MSHASAAPDRFAEESTLLAFRSDLDECEQMCAIDQHRREVSALVHTRDWSQTHASKSDHDMMLCMLIAEAHRQDPLKVPAARAKELINSIRKKSAASHVDKYATLVSELTSLRLFSR